jgi:AraC family transcriptional regulator, transcriptional activator of pobA
LSGLILTKNCSKSNFFVNSTLEFPNAEYGIKRIGRLCEMIQEEASQNQKDLSVVKHLLLALFMMIETERRKSVLNHEKSNGEQNTTLQNFLQILEENYKRPLGVDFYAEKLFMSSRNLNLICKEILNQTVTELIETRKLIEAKNQLTNTSKNISEIGFDLGFKEKTYFTNVFKKRTGQTPSEFRAEMKSILS